MKERKLPKSKRYILVLLCLLVLTLRSQIVLADEDDDADDEPAVVSGQTGDSSTVGQAESGENDDEDDDDDSDEGNDVAGNNEAPGTLAESATASKSKWGETSGNVSLTSDYIFRGRSLTDHQPALQGGFDYNHPIGVYVGAWGSNLHMTDSPETQLELDVYGGYSFDIARDLNLNVGVLHYTYFQGSESNSWDFPVRLSWQGFHAGFDYTPNYEGGPESSWYLTAGWSDEVVWKFKVGGDVGYSFFNVDLLNYADFRLFVSREILGITLEAAGTFVSREQFAGEDAPRLVFTVSKSF